MAAFWERNAVTNWDSYDTFMGHLNSLVLNLKTYQCSLPRFSLQSKEVMRLKRKKKSKVCDEEKRCFEDNSSSVLNWKEEKLLINLWLNASRVRPSCGGGRGNTGPGDLTKCIASLPSTDRSSTRDQSIFVGPGGYKI